MNRTCPHCQNDTNQSKAGKTRTGSQRYKCKPCNRFYTPKPQLPSSSDGHLTVYDLMALPQEEQERVMAKAFELAAQEDFEIFEANELYDYPEDSV